MWRNSRRTGGEVCRQAHRARHPPRRPRPTIDGTLSVGEYEGALRAPVEYFNPDVQNRPAQFFYLWDDEAFYVGLRTLDKQPYSQEAPLWEGDAVEWYFNAQRGADFLSQAWPKAPYPGAVHCFFTAMHLDQVEPRFALRPGFELAIAKTGVEVASQRTPAGLEVEFKLPWINFPQFTPRAGEVIGLDAELSYSDGGPRSFRSFVFGNPLSVQQPANLAHVRLMNHLERTDWQACGSAMMPIRVDLPWSQDGPPHVMGQIAMPPGRRDQIGEVSFNLMDLSGKSLGEYPADRERVLDASGNFVVRKARWPAAAAKPGLYQVIAVISDAKGRELARVAPRLVSVNMAPGY